MGLWAEMSEVERIAHSIRHGNKYHLRDSSQEYLEAANQHNENRKDPYAGVNIASVVRQDGADLASGSQEDRDYLRGAYLKKFQDQMASGNNAWNTEDNYDWRTFLEQGYNLTDEELASIQSTTGTKPDFTFGGSGINIDPGSPEVGHGGTFRPPVNVGGGATGGEAPAGGGEVAPAFDFGPAPDFGEAVQMTNRSGSTPFMDSYMRSREAAKAEGPVSGMMKKWME